MPERAENLDAGTQVVSLVEVRGPNNSLVHPRGAVGVVTRTPAVEGERFLVRFPDGFEFSLRRDQLDILKHFKDRLGGNGPPGRPSGSRAPAGGKGQGEGAPGLQPRIHHPLPLHRRVAGLRTRTRPHHDEAPRTPGLRSREPVSDQGAPGSRQPPNEHQCTRIRAATARMANARLIGPESRRMLAGVPTPILEESKTRKTLAQGIALGDQSHRCQSPERAKEPAGPHARKSAILRHGVDDLERLRRQAMNRSLARAARKGRAACERPNVGTGC